VLTGHFNEQHAQLARTMLHRLQLIEDALAELNAVIAETCRPWAHQLQLLQTIPGVGEKVAQVILAETGGDMSRFPSAAHLAAWAGVAPAIYESAGKRRQAPAIRHGDKWLTAMLVEAAGSVGRMKGTNYLSTQYARPPSTPGSPHAAAWAGLRSRWLTRSWSRPTTSCCAMSPIRSWVRTGWPAATTRRTPAGWSPSSNGSATR
jgi:transposase